MADTETQAVNTQPVSPTKGKVTQKASKDGSNSTLRFLPIAEIHDDTVVLKDGTVRGVMEVTSVNFSLKSEAEQNSIIYSYQQFLNALEFPIQIYIRSKKLDLDDYIAKLSEVADQQPNPLLKNQTLEYIQFVSKLIEYADIMEKKFYVIIPYDLTESSTKKGLFRLFLDTINPDDSIAKYKERVRRFSTMKKGLQQRMNIAQAKLESCGLQTRILSTKELISLYYSVYNPITSMSQKLKEANVNQTKKQ
ncbi:hypothetical protein COW46_01855 [Candidatus Gracilibacteria bacterium CG17_big_fil_post_rev_8_21_14_2_50_48_13]|nr:MAG: hypothetical protein COW46_01855 [Candidatus Gracilibacteria bacterium CG17_big_fil_post_rev_8_21_14_2_50_48_13]